jgi:peptide/nickel transport system permease protein
MYRYIIKRILMLIPVLLGVSFVIFFILELTPGDPAELVAGVDATKEQIEMMREQLGLNDPALVRYFKYIGNMLRGNLGTSYYSSDKVFDLFMYRFPATLTLSLSAVFFATLIAIPIGIVSAVRQNSLLDNAGMVLALIGVSMPSFWLGLLLILAFSLKLGWFPSGGFTDWKSVILPAITLGSAASMASLTRTTRSSMLEAMAQDYMRTARAEGFSERIVVWSHALSNALIPILTAFGLQFGAVMSGAILTETVFSWPGVGRLIVDCVNRRDIPMVMGTVIMTTMFISVVNLIVDIVYAYVDPRIKAQYTK